jgi:N-terminal domain of (some) glycogen debranching enzymes
MRDAMTTPTTDGVDNVRTPTEAVSDFYIETRTSLIERPLRTLKHGDIFALLDSYGDIGVGSHGPEGIFLRDTRYLSGFDLRFDALPPHFVRSTFDRRRGDAIERHSANGPSGHSRNRGTPTQRYVIFHAAAAA